MSTDDSISEDVSSSVALSHCNANAEGDGGKESETSLVSSEGTSTTGRSASEDRQTASQTTGGTVQSRLVDNTPAHIKISNICLSQDVFEHGKNLPFINPSSIETLRGLVQEIRSSGETNPELWKDCEGRWLHLFQLVEKQYQEQILAQQEQYQCQIQLIQDEIKALVQIQNRQANVKPQKDTSIGTKTNDTEDHEFPTISTHCANANVKGQAVNEAELREAAMLSRGLPPSVCAWEPGILTVGSVQDEVRECQKKLPFILTTADDNSRVISNQQNSPSTKEPGLERTSLQSNQQIPFGDNQLLTSWVQRNKLKPKKNKTKPVPTRLTENKELHKKYMDTSLPSQLKSKDSFDQVYKPVGSSFSSCALRRSDSLISEASGLTYWRLHENDLYHPLPDSVDSGVPHLDEEAGFVPRQLSLKEIYCNKQDCKRVVDRDGSLKSYSPSPQPHVFILDPVTTRQSDHTSGFTSPSHFSSPSLSTPSHLNQRAETPITPDSMVESSHNHGDTDCISDVSSVSAARHSTVNAQDKWGLPAKHNISPHRAQGRSQTHPSSLQAEGSTALEDPVVLSLLRQNLREKHSRHVADLKAYYEAEIQNLLDKLQLKDLPKDNEKSYYALSERCKHWEKALADATSRIQELEANNNSLEQKLTEWSERCAVAGATVKSLQKELEESNHSAKEKDNLLVRLKTRIRQLEEAAQRAQKEADEKEAKQEKEYKMLQNLRGEYDSLMNSHESLKSNLVSTENKLVSAHDHISVLKKNISKLESQIKQLEHENQARVRCSPHNIPPSGAGLYHHPDLLLSPKKGSAVPDVTRTFYQYPRKQSHDDSTLIQTNQTIKPICNKFNNEQVLLTGNERPIDIVKSESWKHDCEMSQTKFQEESSGQPELSRKQGSCALTPMMRAIIELEETRATQSRAPWVDNSKSTLGFVEQRLKVPIQDRDILQDLSKPLRRVEKNRVRALQRSLSPESSRSSSLPPPAQRDVPPTTPTKRETLLMPLSAKSSPKRCPTENFSTAFGHLMPREEHFHNRSRKKLLFTTTDREAEQHSSDSAGDAQVVDTNPQLAWEERDAAVGLSHLDRLQSLSEAERLFDELTQEKQQVEAALNRIPSAGSRVSLQTRLDELALENRLERLNRDLGSLRMTLKRFNVLRSSANL